MKKMMCAALMLACLTSGGAMAQTKKGKSAKKQSPSVERTDEAKSEKQKDDAPASGEEATMVMEMKTDEGTWNGLVSADRVPDGYGVLVYAKKDKNGRVSYHGWMKEGQREGEGILIFSNGSLFEGTFKKNSMHEGEFRDPEQQACYKGTFKNDEPWKGAWYTIGDNKKFAEVSNGKTSEVPEP